MLIIERYTSDAFRNLRESFKRMNEVKSSSGDIDLATYLVENNCYIYCPYPADFYPNGITSYTVASHPIDNDKRGIGYISNGSKGISETMVDEKYTDETPVLLIMPHEIDEDLPIDEDNGSTNTSSQDTIYEVKIGYIRCADYCGGLFEGTLELRVARGFPEFNSSTEVVTGKFSTVYPINYPRQYAKAAIRNWTSYSNGGWYKVNALWDSNWKKTKTQQGIIVYEYDRKKEVKVGATVGYKKDKFTAAIETEAKINYTGDFLGIAEWDRSWFYATNTTPDALDEVKYGLVVRKTSDPIKITTPTRTLYW